MYPWVWRLRPLGHPDIPKFHCVLLLTAACLFSTLGARWVNKCNIHLIICTCMNAIHANSFSFMPEALPLLSWDRLVSLCHVDNFISCPHIVSPQEMDPAPPPTQISPLIQWRPHPNTQNPTPRLCLNQTWDKTFGLCSRYWQHYSYFWNSLDCFQ